jgi:hypothetical protein
MKGFIKNTQMTVEKERVVRSMNWRINRNKEIIAMARRMTERRRVMTVRDNQRNKRNNEYFHYIHK